MVSLLLYRYHGVVVGNALGKQEIIRICEENGSTFGLVALSMTFACLPPVCHRLSRGQGLPREGWHRALHLPLVGPILDPEDKVRFFMICATSETKGITKRKKKG